MKSVILFLFLLFSISNAQKESHWFIKAGINISDLRTEQSESVKSYSFGIQKDFTILKNLYLSSEFLISSQGGILRNKPVKNEEYTTYLDSYDISAKIQMFEFSLLVKYDVFKKEKLHVAFNIGPSWRIGLHDESQLSNRQNIYDEDNQTRKAEFENYQFKYVLGESSFINTSGFAFNAGISCTYISFLLELKYSYSFHNIGYIASLESVEHKFNTLHILLGYNF